MRARQAREANRASVLAERRHARATPRVTAVLCFNEVEQGAEDVRAFCEGLVRAVRGDGASEGEIEDVVRGMFEDASTPRTATSARHSARARPSCS